MSIRYNKEEAIRWLKSPDGTKVWVKCHHVDCGWELTDDPDWVSGCLYVVDDRHAEIRKEWIDKGKPDVQFKNGYGKWEDTEKPIWDTYTEYRLKPTEWVTPEGEDPIPYHAKRIDPDWKFNMNDFNQKRWHIGFYTLDKTYTAELSQLQICIGTHYMSQKSAEQIVEALNSGELKLNGTK